MPVNPYPQLSVDEVDLVEVLRALADPVRPRTVARLADAIVLPPRGDPGSSCGQGVALG